MNSNDLPGFAPDQLDEASASTPCRRISLATWITANYVEDDAPSHNTVRRWVRDARIQPAPEKQGRSYYFNPAARYVGPPSTSQ